MRSMSFRHVLAICLLICVVLNPALAQFEVTLNVDYVSEEDREDGRDLLDIFMPEGASEVPVILFFHGGALRAGDKFHGQLLAQRFVPNGIGVVSANYRLSPLVMHPAHVRDAAAATAWVVRNIAKYGGDPHRVFVAGHSAGAYLAALLVLDPTHLATQGLTPMAVQGSIPISAFLYVEEIAANRPEDAWGSDPANWLAASVTPHIAGIEIPMLLIYADGDDEWRRQQNEAFGEAMRKSGAKAVQIVEVPHRDHRSLLTALNSEDDRIGGLVMRFVREHE